MADERLHHGAWVVAMPPRRSEHSRTPRYAAGSRGVVRDHLGRHPLPAAAARREWPLVEDDLYSVEYPSFVLFGTGDHTVHVDLYRTSLEPVR